MESLALILRAALAVINDSNMKYLYPGKYFKIRDMLEECLKILTGESDSD